jgi:hypothetical protein
VLRLIEPAYPRRASGPSPEVSLHDPGIVLLSGAT